MFQISGHGKGSITVALHSGLLVDGNIEFNVGGCRGVYVRETGESGRLDTSVKWFVDEVQTPVRTATEMLKLNELYDNLMEILITINRSTMASLLRPAEEYVKNVSFVLEFGGKCILRDLEGVIHTQRNFKAITYTFNW